MFNGDEGKMKKKKKNMKDRGKMEALVGYLTLIIAASADECQADRDKEGESMAKAHWPLCFLLFALLTQ